MIKIVTMVIVIIANMDVNQQLIQNVHAVQIYILTN